VKIIQTGTNTPLALQRRGPGDGVYISIFGGEGREEKSFY